MGSSPLPRICPTVGDEYEFDSRQRSRVGCLPSHFHLASRPHLGYASGMRRLFPLMLFVLAIPACGADYSARVVGVSDGDTITVLTAAKKQVKVRLHGIDAPETGQDFGSRAKQAASSLAFGKTVTIRPRDTDRYGRTVAEIILPDGRSMNRELVRQGMAWWFARYAPADAGCRRFPTLASVRDVLDQRNVTAASPGALRWCRGLARCRGHRCIPDRKPRGDRCVSEGHRR